jgi:hypothetical protein
MFVGVSREEIFDTKEGKYQGGGDEEECVEGMKSDVHLHPNEIAVEILNCRVRYQKIRGRGRTYAGDAFDIVFRVLWMDVSGRDGVDGGGDAGEGRLDQTACWIEVVIHQALWERVSGERAKRER